jgi:hypothetical protein
MNDAELGRCKADGALLHSVVSERVELKRDGSGRWKGCCPFHNEKTASFTVFNDGGWKCFGCGRHGSVFDYVMERDRVEFAEAVRLIERQHGFSSTEPKRMVNVRKGGNDNNADHREIWEPMTPPPVSAPEAPAKTIGCTSYEYVGADSHLLFYQRRFENADGKKSFAQLTYGFLNGVAGWYPRGPAQPFPLYRLDRITSAGADSWVLVVEGEKACHAAERLFPDYVVTTWLNGANSVSLTDWTPLDRFKTVIWWPDADKRREDGRPHGCFIATPAFCKMFPNAKLVGTDGLAEIADGYDAADLEHLGCENDDHEAWLTERLRAPEPEPDAYAGLAQTLSVTAWRKREMPQITRLLGDFLTTTTRAFIVGATGIGKTLLGLAMAIGMALGLGFLHWRSSRPACVVYIDGEMPRELLIARIEDAARQADRPDLLDNLMVFSMEDAEMIAERWPTLGMFMPLNTDAGQEFIKRLCAALKPDVVIFDNVQALLEGVQKEEETWTAVLPLVQWLSKQPIGQLWLDHSGHNSIRQYGTVIKAWRSDAVAIITPLPEDDRVPGETAFVLSFEPPGKARRRTPDNREDFATTTIRLREGRWSGEAADSEQATSKRARGKVPPSIRLFHDALLSAIAGAATRPGETAMFAWEAECVRQGLLDQIEPGDDANARHRKRSFLRKAKSSLLAAGMIGINSERVADLTRRW